MEKLLLVSIIGGVGGAIAGMSAQNGREILFFHGGIGAMLLIAIVAFL